MSAYTPTALHDPLTELVAEAAHDTLDGFFALARSRILGHPDPDQVAADASPADLPPNLEAWPDSAVWAELVRRHLAPAIGIAFDMAFDAAARSDLLQVHRYRQTFMDQVWDRLSLGLWADGTFDLIRGDLAEGLDAGESVPDLRARIADQLQVSRYSYLADRIARTEAHTAAEGGTWSAMAAWEDLSGEVMYQQWIASADERTRDTHMAASGQRVRLNEPFDVGGYPLQYPGDPHGPAAEVINCRCSTLVGTWEELQELPPSAADTQGSAMSNTSPRDGEHATTVTVTTDTPAAPTTAAAEPGSGVTGHWEGVLAPLDVRGDVRILASPDGDQVPTADRVWLSWQEKSSGGHDGKVAIGTVDHAWVQDGHLHGRGRYDLADPVAAEAARKVDQGFAGTISVDLTDLEDAVIEYGLYDRDDRPVDIDGWDYEELYDAVMSGDLRELMVISNWRLGGATLVQDPAFHTTRNDKGAAFITTAPEPVEVPQTNEEGAGVDLAAGATPTPAEGHQEEAPEMSLPALTAAAGIAPETATWAEQVAAVAPLEPDPAWFANPRLDGPTKVRVTDEGRVYGHVACWDTGHIGYAGQDVRPPRSHTGYGHFRRNRIRCADGSLVFAGTIVMGTGHADMYASPASAMEHYDDTGYAVADVVCGEDEHGIWFSGSLKPGVSALQVLTLDRYSLSGDWRNGELVGVCVVSVPGFPISDAEANLSLAASGARMSTPRLRMRTHRGQECALVACGVVPMAARNPSQAADPVRLVQEWTKTLDTKMQHWMEQVREGSYRAGLQAAQEGPEMRRLAQQVNADAVEEARSAIEQDGA